MRKEAERISKETMRCLSGFAKKVKGHDPYTYCMKKTHGGKCVFLNEKTCTIYPIRPLTCKFYPFELKAVNNGVHVFQHTDECPSIGNGPQLRREYFMRLFDELKHTMEDA